MLSSSRCENLCNQASRKKNY